MLKHYTFFAHRRCLAKHCRSLSLSFLNKNLSPPAQWHELYFSRAEISIPCACESAVFATPCFSPGNFRGLVAAPRHEWPRVPARPASHLAVNEKNARA